jgi:hypothetical protein
MSSHYQNIPLQIECFSYRIVISVSCLFGHYPSSQFLNKITTFQRLALSPSSGGKGKGVLKREVILAGGW